RARACRARRARRERREGRRVSRRQDRAHRLLHGPGHGTDARAREPGAGAGAPGTRARGIEAGHLPRLVQKPAVAWFEELRTETRSIILTRRRGERGEAPGRAQRSEERRVGTE